MAISKNISLTNNFGEQSSFNNVYCKVTSFGGSKENFSFDVGTFKEKNGTLLSRQNYNLVFDFEGPNPIKQAYLHLKSLPEFSDAVDC